MTYSLITIIFNPNSTGQSESKARELKQQITSLQSDVQVELIATERAGHAEEIAYSAAKKTKRPLIISSSGDGGYHEVVNGLLKAQQEGATPTAGLLPAGNANDHHRNVSGDDSSQLIITKTPTSIDVLSITATVNGKKVKRYAHSYIGLGLTPIVGAELNKVKLNVITEAWVVLRSLLWFKPVKLIIDGKKRRYESVIFSNIESMSKYLKIAQSSSVRDGKFEVTMFKSSTKLQLLVTLLRTSAGIARHDESVSEFTLTTINETLVQADGEIMKVDANTEINIGIEPQVLASVA